MSAVLQPQWEGEESFPLTGKMHISPAGWLCWLEHRPTHRGIAGLIPGQGTYQSCASNLGQGECGRQLISLSTPLSIPSSFSKINKHKGEDF